MAGTDRATSRVATVARLAAVVRGGDMSQVARRAALSRGLRRGGGWTILALVLWTPRILRVMFGRRSEIVTTSRVRPGETIEVRATRQPTRRERRSG